MKPYYMYTFKVRLSPCKKICFIYFNESPKKDEKCFLFDIKSSICSQDVLDFVWLFSSCIKTDQLERLGK